MQHRLLFQIPLLIFGVFCCSTAVIMIKTTQTHPVLLSALRLFVATAALSPVFFRALRRHRHAFTAAHLRATLFPGVTLAVHFISWIAGARMTPAANSSLIVNLVPVVMPVMLVVFLKERLTKTELLATVIAMVGVVVLTSADFSIDPQHFLGDMVCFGSMLALAYYMLLGRRNRDIPSLWLYVVPVYAIAGVICFAVSLFFVSPFQPYPPGEVLLILGLGLVPTVLGHSILNYAMKHMRGQVVSILNMGQFIFAAVMAYFIYAEVPGWPLYAASALVVSGAILVVNQTLSRKPEGAVPMTALDETAAPAAGEAAPTSEAPTAAEPAPAGETLPAGGAVATGNATPAGEQR